MIEERGKKAAEIWGKPNRLGTQLTDADISQTKPVEDRLFESFESIDPIKSEQAACYTHMAAMLKTEIVPELRKLGRALGILMQEVRQQG